MGDYKAQRKASAIDGQNIKWNWGDDWPDALDVISRGVQGRPLSKIFSILDLLDELNHGSYCRRPRPGKPGGKPLAATQSGWPEALAPLLSAGATWCSACQC